MSADVLAVLLAAVYAAVYAFGYWHGRADRKAARGVLTARLRAIDGQRGYARPGR